MGAVGSVGFVNFFQKEKMLHWSRRVCTSCDRLIVDTTRFFDPGLYSSKSNCKLVQSRLLLLHIPPWVRMVLEKIQVAIAGNSLKS